jgi:cellulose synthase/poly-beta-1,6-N-acetylglucosamine synthase-like glycosyltransferase
MAQHGDSIVAGLFFAAFAVPAYSYFVFPAILYVLVRMKAKTFNESEDQEPSVTLLISAYNEAAVIEEKIQNSLNLDYPSRTFGWMGVWEKTYPSMKFGLR